MKNENPSSIRNSRDYRIGDELDHSTILNYALEKNIDIAFVSPDPVLDTPLVDSLTAKGIAVASPNQSAARIETSKEYMRNLLLEHNIPGNIDYRIFKDYEEMACYVRKSDDEYAIKPIGLTGGKGVRVMGEQIGSRDEAISYGDEVIKRNGEVLVEKKVTGEEFSLQVYSDGAHISPMPIVQDYKRAFEGDKGPNTGGMGSISDHDGLSPFVKKATVEQAKGILQKVVDTMREDGNPFRGVMYGQFMQAPDGAKIIEINSRFGDPEGMNVLTLLEDDFTEVLFGIAGGNLKTSHNYMKKATVLKYIVPDGYGISPMPGELEVDPESENDAFRIYYSAVSGSMQKVKMSSSRSLALIGIADSIPEASDIVESKLGSIHGKYSMRHDIGTREFLKKKMEKVS